MECCVLNWDDQTFGQLKCLTSAFHVRSMVKALIGIYWKPFLFSLGVGAHKFSAMQYSTHKRVSHYKEGCVALAPKLPLWCHMRLEWEERLLHWVLVIIKRSLNFVQNVILHDNYEFLPVAYILCALCGLNNIFSLSSAVYTNHLHTLFESFDRTWVCSRRSSPYSPFEMSINVTTIVYRNRYTLIVHLTYSHWYCQPHGTISIWTCFLCRGLRTLSAQKCRKFTSRN